MPRLNDFYDDASPGEVFPSIRHRDARRSPGKKRLKPRREIEDIREQRRLKRQVDPYAMDDLLP